MMPHGKNRRTVVSHHTDEFDNEDWDEPDFGDGDYSEDDWADDEEESIPCPYCGKQVHEDSQRCPHCESYISREDAPATVKPLWLLLGTAAVLVVVYIWIRLNE
jgi:predicted nucleic acid-binding Zn ribbon protein